MMKFALGIPLMVFSYYAGDVFLFLISLSIFFWLKTKMHVGLAGTIYAALLLWFFVGRSFVAGAAPSDAIAGIVFVIVMPLIYILPLPLTYFAMKWAFKAGAINRAKFALNNPRNGQHLK